MPDLLVRDLDEKTIDLLKAWAESQGKSLQSELRRILEATAHASDVESALALAGRVRAALPDRVFSDIAEEIRAFRDGGDGRLFSDIAEEIRAFRDGGVDDD